MITQAQRIALCFAGGHLRRWHCSDIIGDERVDSHTWGMVSLILILHPDPSMRLIRAVQFHDAGEMFSGDIPHPAKVAVPSLGAGDKEVASRWSAVTGLGNEKLSLDEEWWLRFVDSAQAFLFAWRQVTMGNGLMMRKANEIGANCVALMATAPREAADAWESVKHAVTPHPVTRTITDLEKGNVYG